jgi:hypothetical protein
MVTYRFEFLVYSVFGVNNMIFIQTDAEIVKYQVYPPHTLVKQHVEKTIDTIFSVDEQYVMTIKHSAIPYFVIYNLNFDILYIFKSPFNHANRGQIIYDSKIFYCIRDTAEYCEVNGQHTPV